MVSNGEGSPAAIAACHSFAADRQADIIIGSMLDPLDCLTLSAAYPDQSGVNVISLV